MKKLLSFIAIFMLSATINTNATNTKVSEERESCFSWAREFVIAMEGEINLDNVGFVNELTEYLGTTGLCNRL